MIYDKKVLILKKIYPIESIMKAMYNFLNDIYIHISEDEEYWILSFKEKDSCRYDNITYLLENEILAETIRLNVYRKTKNIRSIIMARAMSSSFIDNNNDVVTSNISTSDDESLKMNEILKDWFDRNG
ncbi:MAG: His-Xaa-Ser system protein HxsD [Selenomonadaceae bacterium]|nr:His-Xaa-Ser system protein HxsD [Selenomonadaceae bacterium]